MPDLRQRFGDRLVEALKARIRSGASPEISPEAFAAGLGRAYPDAEIDGFLDAAADDGLLTRDEGWICAVATCRQPMDADARAGHLCPTCDTDDRETGEEPLHVVRYRIQGGVSRDIHWLIAVHGMNTRGQWQEDFSWRIANKLKYSAPVLIYKYGWASWDVLFAWRHRQLARGLGERIRAAVTFARSNGITAPPDIVVHSFGSRLFSLVLLDEAFSDLRFGRVITAGCIIRPDFDWSRLIVGGRVEAVLNHCGGKDRPVPWAHYTIPGTGPAARRGFGDPKAFNAMDADFGHSSCFARANLTDNLGKGGLWDRFLQHPLETFSDPRLFTPEAWRPAWWPARLIVRLVVLALVGAVVLGVFGAFAIGAYEVAGCLRGLVARIGPIIGLN
ncbi:MAG: hypothetical protein J0H01_14660 [Rhizobiales bacterium]|nr:hypothetical protein [Hyphomicrobiales bacterium]